MKKQEQEVDIAVELRVHIARKYRTQTAAAQAWKCSPAFVSAVLSGAKVPNDAMLEDAGFQRVKTTRYVRINDQQHKAERAAK